MESKQYAQDGTVTILSTEIMPFIYLYFINPVICRYCNGSYQVACFHFKICNLASGQHQFYLLFYLNGMGKWVELSGIVSDRQPWDEMVGIS